MREQLAEFEALASIEYINMVQRELGAEGIKALQRLLRGVRSVHRAITSERLSQGLLVAVPLGPAKARYLLPGAADLVPHAKHLTARHDGNGPLAVAIGDDGTLHLWSKSYAQFRRQQFLAYEFQAPGVEFIQCPGAGMQVPQITGVDSIFNVPYFLDLQGALAHYEEQCVKYAQCSKFGESWADAKRLMFRPKPEHFMRDSLLHFLRTSLRQWEGVDAMPEQNVNATRPVDIRVTWVGSNRVALIEVKWLGASGTPGGQRFTKTWSESRAQDGARQLADYLDIFHGEQPHLEARGYLAVFDGRRRRLKITSVAVEPADAFAFRTAAITYDQKILDRSDFAPPFRFFCEPISP